MVRCVIFEVVEKYIRNSFLEKGLLLVIESFTQKRAVFKWETVEQKKKRTLNNITFNL